MYEKRKYYSEYFMYAIITIWFSSEVNLNTRLEYIFFWKSSDCNDFIARLCLVLLTIQIVFLQEYSFHELVIIVLASIPIIIGTINSNYNLMISAWMFIVASKYIDFDRIIKIAYAILLIMIPLVLLLCFAGFIEDRILFRGSVIRHSLGFAHPNWLGVRVFQLIVMHCYIKRNRLTVVDYLLILLGALFVDKVPNCKTAYYCLIVFLIMLIAYKLSDAFVGGKDLFIRATIAIAVCSNILSVVLSIVDVKSFHYLRQIDEFMSNRFFWCHKVLKFYGWSWFGRNIEIYGKRMGRVFPRFYLDTAYMALLLRYGFIVYIFFSGIYLLAMIKCMFRKKDMLVIILSMYAIYGVMENALFSVTQNIFLLLLAIPLYSLDFNENKELQKDSRKRYKLVL